MADPLICMKDWESAQFLSEERQFRSTVIISWGSASLLAATAVKDFLAAHGIKGRVRYYDCPAEKAAPPRVHGSADPLWDPRQRRPEQRGVRPHSQPRLPPSSMISG